MKFIKVREIQDLYKDDKYVPVEAEVNINIDNISMIRETVDGLSVFIIGRDKAIRIKNIEDINLVLKECKLKQLKE